MEHTSRSEKKKLNTELSDSKYQTIKTHTINRNPDKPFCMSELTRIF